MKQGGSDVLWTVCGGGSSSRRPRGLPVSLVDGSSGYAVDGRLDRVA